MQVKLPKKAHKKDDLYRFSFSPIFCVTGKKEIKARNKSYGIYVNFRANTSQHENELTHCKRFFQYYKTLYSTKADFIDFYDKEPWL